MVVTLWISVLTKLSKLARLGRLNAKELKAAADTMKWSPAKLERELLAARHLPGVEGQLARDIVGTIGDAALGTLVVEAAVLVISVLSWPVIIIGTLVIGAVVGGYYYWQSDKPIVDDKGNVIKPIPTPCPTQTPRVQKCPWTPEGYSIEPCNPGWCWDGGPQGSLACKQEESVPNSGRTYTSDLVCSEGYIAERDPCTNVIIQCIKNN